MTDRTRVSKRVPCHGRSSLIRFVLPFAAGSAVDALARFYGQKISEVVRITRLPETNDRLPGFAWIGGSPQEFGNHIKANLARIGKVVREAGIKAE